MSDFQAVILSGGSGTRLWPVSRDKHPKQLQPLVDGESLLQNTLRRLDGLSTLPPLVVSNEEYRFVTAEQLRLSNCKSWRLVLEPCGRNTAPALTAAALLARSYGADRADGTDGADPVLLACPADHHVGNVDAFRAAIRCGLPAAEAGAVVTFGVVPDRAETGYGYLETQGDGSLRSLLAFVEKPDASTAARYLAGGRHLWNSGMFMLRASVWLRAVGALAPEILAACEQAVASAVIDGDFTRLGAAAFAASPSDSIDYAVMEKLAAATTLDIPCRAVPLDAGWSDVGAWDALCQVIPQDADGNSVRGDVWLDGVSDTLALSEHRLLACVGCSDLVVVETADAVLVASKAHAQDVKKIVARLKAAKRNEIVDHRKVHRPWGWYDSIDRGDRFQVKRIVVRPGATLSLQLHHHRAEHWIVVRGTAKVTCGEETRLLGENESTFIPLGVKHRLENPGQIPLEIIEVQSGAYLGEDDIVRFDDQYGRTK